MARDTLFSRLFRRRDEVSRSTISLSQYLQQWLANPFGMLYPPAISYHDGHVVERVENSFEAYTSNAFKANPIVFGLMQRRASVFSEARFAWRKVENANPGDLLDTDEGLELLRHPWPNGTTGNLLVRMIQDVDLAGNAYVVRERDRLRRLRPDWVQIVLTGDPLVDPKVDIMGYIFTPGGPDRGPGVPYLPDEICHWAPLPDPIASFRGMSWLTPVIREIQADQAAMEHKLRFMEKGAVLGPIVKAPPGLTADQFRKFVEAFESAHAGKDKAYAITYLANGSDVTLAQADMRQLDFKNLSGSAETRLSVAAGVPAVIAGISEGLAGSSLNAGNYAAAKRSWADGGLRPLWRSACAALATITPAPDENSELWYVEQDIPFLREDQQDVAQIQQSQATTINTLITAGYEPKSIVVAVRDNDLSALEHTGMTSVQLTPPGMGANGEIIDGEVVEDTAGEDAYQQALDELRAGQVETARALRMLTAAIDEISRARQRSYDGAMIALVPAEQDAQRIAVPKGEPVDELHMTLYYLGDAKDIPKAARQQIVDTLRAFVDRRVSSPLTLNAFGAALWNPLSDDPAWVLNVGDLEPRPSGQEPLAVLRRAVSDALAYGAPEFRMPKQHTPWQPHVCAAYSTNTTNMEDLGEHVGPVVFDRIRVAFAGDVVDIPLGGNIERRRPYPGQRYRHGWIPVAGAIDVPDAPDPRLGRAYSQAELEVSYGEAYDNVEFSPGMLLEIGKSGMLHIDISSGEEDRYYIFADMDQDDSFAEWLTSALDWAAWREVDEYGQRKPDPENGLIDWYEDDGSIVGFDRDGNVRIGLPTGEGHVKVLNLTREEAQELWRGLEGFRVLYIEPEDEDEDEEDEDEDEEASDGA